MRVAVPSHETGMLASTVEQSTDNSSWFLVPREPSKLPIHRHSPRPLVRCQPFCKCTPLVVRQMGASDANNWKYNLANSLRTVGSVVPPLPLRISHYYYSFCLFSRRQKASCEDHCLTLVSSTQSKKLAWGVQGCWTVFDGDYDNDKMMPALYKASTHKCVHACVHVCVLALERMMYISEQLHSRKSSI